MSLRGLAYAFLVAGGAHPALAASGSAGPMVRVELVSEVRAISPGETFWGALHQRIAPGWHTVQRDVAAGRAYGRRSMTRTRPPGDASGETEASRPKTSTDR